MSRVSDIYRNIAASGRDEVFITLRPESEVEADHRAAVATGGPLAGLILAVKDNVDVAGLPTTAACPGFAYVPDIDAPAVAALTAAGAVVIGKTNLDQFATGLVGTRSPYGAVRDSRRPEHISGGSSSGSAVAVALGFADIAIGTDTAGSGRVPAGLQGIIGIKPTLGVVSTAGVVPACASYDCVTIFAADLATAQRAMAAMGRAGGEREWPHTAPLAAAPHPRIAVPDDLAALDPVWQAGFGAAIERAQACGFDIIEIPMQDFFAAADLLYNGALVAERADAVGDFVALPGAGVDGGGPRSRGASPLTEPAGLDPTVAGIIAAAGGHTAVGLLADRRRVAALRERALAHLDGCDALMVPTAPRHPTIAEVEADPIAVNTQMGRYTNFCNLFDMCAIAIPSGTVGSGTATAQFGVTLLATAHHDAVLADLAARFLALAERPAWPESLLETAELAVFGLHLRGQPLDHQLTGRGARWAGPVRTAPIYRLFELDTEPPKPGMVRDGDSGAAIVGESWVLPIAALGQFLAGLPAPMQLGKITLDDGREVIGFGCEYSAAIAGRDITTAGGWIASRHALAAGAVR